jgi:hypothetical protein
MGFVLLVLAGAVAITVYWRLAVSAAEGKEAAHDFLLLETSTLLVPAALGLMLAFYLLNLRCDESCDRNYEWWHTLDAWQWHGQFAFALAGAAAVAAAFTLTIRRRYYGALFCLVAAAGLYASWALFFLAPFGERFGI